MNNKFSNMETTAKNEPRAFVTLKELTTLWFNTGTQCNLSCHNCYIESSPKNDRLVYLSKNDMTPFLKEIGPETKLIAFTGGEPFINPNIIDLLTLSLETNRDVLVLTNAYRVLKRHESALIDLKNQYGPALHLRISLDHYTKDLHEHERGLNTFEKTLDQVKWLFDQGFNISIAGRSIGNEDKDHSTRMYQELLLAHGIDLALSDEKFVIFPEMMAKENVPEISVHCWDILNKSPDDQMCASERMIVKRKGHDSPVVLPCTLIAYDEKFDLGRTLSKSRRDVFLNHEFCAKFCVLGGASCSSAK